MNPFERNASEALAELIKLADVKITKRTLIKALLRHPHFPSLASLKDVLTDCKIKAIAARGSIEKLSGLPLPALAFLKINGGFFAPIRKVTDTHVEWYHTQKGWQNDTLYEFEQKWNGAILLIEPTADSNEKNYNSKRIQELLTHSLFPVIAIGTLGFIGLLFWNRHSLYSSGENWLIGLLVLIKLSGAGLSGLLLWQSIHYTEPVLRKSSSLIIEKGKNTNLLNSKGGYLFNWLSWAEIGIIYFVGSILGICIAAIFNEKIIGQLFVLNMISLAFTFYLVYYQAIRAKKWCLACCIVLVLFWLESVVCYYFLENFNFSGQPGYSLLVSYLFTIAIYAVIKPVMISQKQWHEVIQEMKRMKFNPEYVGSIFSNNTQLPPVFENMKVIGVGDPNAKSTVTLIYSPVSKESADAHNGLQELFRTENDVYWQIIFLPTCEQDIQIMHAIFNCPEETALRSMDQWFADIDQPVEKWKDGLNRQLGLSDDEIKSQIALHANWCNLAKIATIPGVFIDGVPIPAVYQTYDIS
ncbi:MAG TPA: cysteine peptidase family C39 domain-containing protein, partial [Dyadobacter sp.]|nr:cysteine peptidase family C39 domain-containing protein [Dyadobacter sp.]